MISVSYESERSGRERRGQKLRNWAQSYWKRYYLDNPEKDRRSSHDRRRSKIPKE